jgi:hypothetical protein
LGVEHELLAGVVGEHASSSVAVSDLVVAKADWVESDAVLVALLLAVCRLPLIPVSPAACALLGNQQLTLLSVEGGVVVDSVAHYAVGRHLVQVVTLVCNLALSTHLQVVLEHSLNGSRGVAETPRLLRQLLNPERHLSIELYPH